MAAKPATKAKTVAASKTATKKAAKPMTAAKKPAARANPKKSAETVTLKTVFEQLAEAHDLPKKQAQSLLTGFVTSVIGILKNGDRIRMSGLGILAVKTREARMGRNPPTGESIQIKASRKVGFRPAKELKDAI